jgi:hypothetical protein
MGRLNIVAGEKKVWARGKIQSGIYPAGSSCADSARASRSLENALLLVIIISVTKCRFAAKSKKNAGADFGNLCQFLPMAFWEASLPSRIWRANGLPWSR